MRYPVLLLLLPVFFLSACGDGNGDSNPAGKKSAAQPPPREMTGLHGYVFDGGDRRPIAGAEFWVRLPLGAGREGLEGFREKSDRWGRFVLDIDERLKPLIDAPAFLETSAEGYVSRTDKFSPYNRGVQMALTRAGSVAGHVADLGGIPLAGALVYVLPPGVPGRLSVEQMRSTTSGPNGEFVIDRLLPGKWLVGAKLAGHLPDFAKERQVKAGERTEMDVLILRPGRRIAGIVRTTDGVPIPRVRVFAFQDEAHKLLALPGPGVHRGDAKTDEEGRFTIDGLATGEYTVQAERSGYKAANAAIRGVTTGTEDVALSLIALGRVQLAVIDRESGAPIEKFTISISPLEKNTHLREELDVVSPAGSYGFAALPGERYQIDVTAEGHDVLRVMVGPIKAGETKLLRIPLVPR